MHSWSARFRRAAAVLLGLHLAQTTALASIAPCEVRGAPAASSAVGPDATADAPSVVAPHDHGAMHHEPASPETSQPQGGSHAPSVCSMAMACAVVASPTTPVSLPNVRDRLLDEGRPNSPATIPTAAPQAPEPPPPKS